MWPENLLLLLVPKWCWCCSIDEGPHWGNQCSCQCVAKATVVIRVTALSTDPALWFHSSAWISYVDLYEHLTFSAYNGLYPVSFHNILVPVTVERCKRNWSCSLDGVSDTLEVSGTDFPSFRKHGNKTWVPTLSYTAKSQKAIAFGMTTRSPCLQKRRGGRENKMHISPKK